MITDKSPHRTGRALAATAATAVALTLTAATEAAPDTPPPSPPHAAATDGGDNGIEKQSARTIADRARRALDGAGSLRARLTDRSAASSTHRPRSLDLTLDRQGNCTGSMAIGRGTLSLVKRGEDVWLRPDEEFWKQQVPRGGGAIARITGDRYVHGTVRNRFLRRLSAACDLDTFRTAASRATSGAAVLRKGRATTVHGTRAVPLSGSRAGRSTTLYISAEGTPYPVQARVRGRNADATTVFDGFGKPVPSKTPAPDDSVDIAKLVDRLPGR